MRLESDGHIAQHLEAMLVRREIGQRENAIECRTQAGERGEAPALRATAGTGARLLRHSDVLLQ
jgi:hypothetical protein